MGGDGGEEKERRGGWNEGCEERERSNHSTEYKITGGH